MEQFPSEFPSEEEQLKQLENKKRDIKENLRKFGVDEKQVDNFIKGFPTPEHLSDDVKQKIKEAIEKLKGIKIREDFIKNKE